MSPNSPKPAGNLRALGLSAAEQLLYERLLAWTAFTAADAGDCVVLGQLLAGPGDAAAGKPAQVRGSAGR